jgi:preprotein translocase subunit SecD
MGRRERRTGWIALCTIAVLASGTGVAAASPTHTRGPEPVVYTVIGTPRATHARLTTSAAILQRRFRALGAKHAVVRVRNHRLVATDTRAVAQNATVAQQGRLELRPVLAILPPGSQAAEQPDGTIPAVLSGRPTNDPATSVSYQVGPPGLTNRGVHTAKAQFGDGQGWMIDLSLNRRGEVALNRMAGALYPRDPPQNAVALVVDGVVQSAPAFQTDDFNGDVAIAGNFTKVQARTLAVALRYGALPLHLRRFTPTR